MLRTSVLAVIGLGLIGAAAAQAPVPPPLGAGLEGIADYAYTQAFADLVKQSRGFGPPDQPWAPGGPALDANGWPTGDFGVILSIHDGLTRVAGTYKISFRCATTPTIGLVASSGQIQNVVRNATSGVVFADLVVPSTSGQIMLSFTGTQGGVRDLKVMRPGLPQSQLFTTPFLNHLRRFSTIRFMDWTKTNGNPTVRWADRSLPTTPSFAAHPAGVSWETCIDLVNLLDKDMWVNVPAMANNDYILQMARLFKARLEPERKLYLEYSNEVWNWGFQQAQWNLQQAKLEVGRGGSPLNFDGDTSEGNWAARRIVKRIFEIQQIFKTEFGSERAGQLRPVLATQVGWPQFWLVEGLKFANLRYGRPENYLYGVGLAPYFNLGTLNDDPLMTKDQVLNALDASVESLRTDNNMELCAALAYANRLKLVAYEGGPDTFGGNGIAAKKAASLDPRIRTISAKYLRIWYGYGADLFNWFVAGATNYDSPYGTWGLTNDMANQSAPKILAINDVLGATTAIPYVQGQVFPGTIDPRRWADRPADWSTWADQELASWDWRGPQRLYLLRTNSAALLRIDLNARAEGAGLGVEVWIDNRRIGTIPVPENADYVRTTQIRYQSTPGMHGLVLRVVGSGKVRIQDVRIIN